MGWLKNTLDKAEDKVKNVVDKAKDITQDATQHVKDTIKSEGTKLADRAGNVASFGVKGGVWVLSGGPYGSAFRAGKNLFKKLSNGRYSDGKGTEISAEDYASLPEVSPDGNRTIGDGIEEGGGMNPYLKWSLIGVGSLGVATGLFLLIRKIVKG